MNVKSAWILRRERRNDKQKKIKSDKIENEVDNKITYYIIKFEPRLSYMFKQNG